VSVAVGDYLATILIVEARQSRCQARGIMQRLNSLAVNVPTWSASSLRGSKRSSNRDRGGDLVVSGQNRRAPSGVRLGRVEDQGGVTPINAMTAKDPIMSGLRKLVCARVVIVLPVVSMSLRSCVDRMRGWCPFRPSQKIGR
jgi:hypothetical protein